MAGAIKEVRAITLTSNDSQLINTATGIICMPIMPQNAGSGLQWLAIAET